MATKHTDWEAAFRDVRERMERKGVSVSSENGAKLDDATMEVLIPVLLHERNLHTVPEDLVRAVRGPSVAFREVLDSMKDLDLEVTYPPQATLLHDISRYEDAAQSILETIDTTLMTAEEQAAAWTMLRYVVTRGSQARAARREASGKPSDG